MIDVYRRRRAGERSVLARRHVPAHRQGGVVAAICTVGGDGAALSPGIDQRYPSALAKLEALRAEVDESDGAYEVICSRAELDDCVRRDVFAIIPSLEGASPLEGDLRRIEEFHERGLRVLGPHLERANELVSARTGAKVACPSSESTRFRT